MLSKSTPSYHAKDYTQYRPFYPDSLYNRLREYVGLKDGEKVELAVDLGCGTGQVTLTLRDKLADKVFGVDLAENMIKQARENASDKSDVNFVVGSDGTLTSQFKKHSVDLITVATAAHWLSYPDFWEAAHYVLKPGGTLALWTYYVSNVIGYPEALKAIEDFAFSPDKCGQYWNDGHEIVHNMYADLQLPQNLYTEEERVVNDYHELRPEQPFELIKKDVPVRDLIGLLRTYSSYINWKKAHPDAKDIVDETQERILSSTGLTLDSRVTIKWGSVYIFAKTKPVSQ